MLLRCTCVLLLGFQHTYGWYQDLFGWFWNKPVCYQGYGCFSTEHPFSNSEGYLPQSPKYLNVSLVLFTRNRNSPYVTTGELPWRFNSSKDTKLIIHGYYNTIRNKWVKDMKDALLKKGDSNVFILDWEEAASSLNYLQSVANTRTVAAITAKILISMTNTKGVDPNSIHIIGFSLGAHVAGYIGNAIPGLGRITGLDPAGPNFEQTSTEDRLDPEDARFVDVIHTDGDTLLNIDLSPGFGAVQPIGHADFYLNGGLNQPGCATNINQHIMNILMGKDPVRNFGCSHLRAIDVFIESINSDCKFASSPCAQLPVFPCNAGTSTANIIMGYNAVRNNIGTFRTNTSDRSPFCLL